MTTILTTIDAQSGPPRRAFFDERSNDVVHILPPQYHGNPLSEEGSLVFTDFGWDILDTLKEIGFEKANLIVYYSAPKAYFCVGPGIAFEAVERY